MALPHAEQAIVEPRKIRDYLLSSAHPLGRFKAAFFQALGYSGEDWGALATDLRRHAADGAVGSSESTPHGEKYRVNGALTGPNRKQADVVSIWIILEG
jgi:hypothetical protein